MVAVENSKAIQYAASKGWSFRTTEDHIIIEECPICGKDNYHFYMRYTPPDKDGVYDCKHCGQSGNLYTLREYLGDRSANLTSVRDVALATRAPAPLPDVESAHKALFEEEDVEHSALDYLVGRGYSTSVIERFKIGLVQEYGKRWIVYPYLNKGVPVYAKFRSIPPDKKEFRGLSGRECPLFNQDVLQRGMEELILCEGEGDTLACVSNGVEYVVGVPGANVKKAGWIKLLDDLAPKNIFILYDRDKVGQDAAREMAARVGIDKVRNILLPDFKWVDENGEEHDGKDINEWFRAGHTLEEFEKLKAEARPFDVDGIHSASEVIDEIKQQLLTRGTLEPKWKASAWPSLNKLLPGYEPGDLIGILAEEKRGKFQPIHSKVLMSDGTWKRIGDLEIGDSLASVDGEESFVTGLFPQGVQPNYEVEFWDGRKTLAGGPHLWRLYRSDVDGFLVETTDTIRSRYAVKGVDNGGIAIKDNIYVETISGEFGKDDLPVDPWLLGVLLGDGCLVDSVNFTTCDEYIRRRVEEITTTLGLHVKPIGSHRKRFTNGHIAQANKEVKQFSITGVDNDGTKTSDNVLLYKLRSLGLIGTSSNTKFIPEIYLRASRSSRVALLQGLMDTDGTVSALYGCPSYCTISQQLAKDVVYLVRSLGGVVKLSPARKKHCTYKGHYVDGKDAFVLNIRLNNRQECVSLPRKLERLTDRKHKAHLSFKCIRYAGEFDSQCIMVSHPSHLYITDDFIVTHNTTVALNLLDHFNKEYNEPVLAYCQEMAPSRLVRKWMSMVTETPDKDITLATVDQALTIAAGREADFLFGYTKTLDRKHIFDTIRQAVRRYGVKCVMFDNLQLLCRNLEHTAQETSATTKEFKQLAMELGIVIFLIMQPSAVREGEIVSSRKVYGSSAPGKDVDAMICLHRNRVCNLKEEEFATAGFVEVEENFAPELLTRVDLSRYSAGGVTTLMFDGAKSKVTEFTQGQLEQRKSLMPIDPSSFVQQSGFESA